MKKLVPIIIITFSLFLLVGKYFLSSKQEIFLTHSIGWLDKPMFRLVAYHEKNFTGVTATNYVFESLSNENARHEITRLRYDEAIQVPSQNLKIASEEIGYFWFGWEFGVTTDGGKSWTIWNAETDSVMQKAINYELIENVIIETTGKGTMHFNEIGREKSGVNFLLTDDFGKTWHR